ncbi:MAG TPA: TolC family protein [Kofleriaceae bacterium]|jgi:outer membrane protein TolC|nr:TolC family protein [Kofleriaceae bacterium]
MGHAFRGALVRAIAAIVLFRVVSPAGRAAQAAPGDPAELADLRELALSDVVTVAVRQSPDLARARIDVTAARAQLTRAEGSEDTHLGAQAQVQLYRAGATDPNTNFEIDTANVSVTRALPTGGTLGVSLNGERLSQPGFTTKPDSTMPVPTLFNLYSTGLGLKLTQPLLRGAGSEAFEAPIHQAERLRDAAALTSEARARDLLVSLSQAYWQVAFAWRQLEVRRISLDLARQQLAYTEGAIRAEKVPRSELLAVQQAIATRQQDVIAGQQDLYERSLALRQLAGLEIGPDAIALKTEALPARITPIDPQIGPVVREAFEHSAELAAAVATRRAAEIAAAAADNAARSRLDLEITGGPTGVDDTASHALSSAFHHPSFSVIAGLTGDHAIEQRTERGGQAAARAAVMSARIAERDAQARLAVRVTRAVQRTRAAIASVALGDQAIDLAEQNVVAEQKRFELGRSTNFDVLRRQDELEQARLRKASAVADYLAARADLDGLSGAILARYHIVMP